MNARVHGGNSGSITRIIDKICFVIRCKVSDIVHVKDSVNIVLQSNWGRLIGFFPKS